MNIAETLVVLLYLLYFVVLPPILKRAGKPAWHGFVPILQYISWLKILGRPWYWVFLIFVTGVNLLVLIILNVETGIAFNKRSVKDQWFMGALPWVALPMLAFKETEAKFVGPRDWSKTKKSFQREWGEAILFAVIAASVIRTFFFEAFTIPTGSMEGSMLVGDYLFVSKMSYGAKLPQTPLSVPFIHNAMPGSMRNSYVEWIELPYYRLPGFGKVDRYDPVVFNFPHGDSIIVDPVLAGHDYYAILRKQGIAFAGNDLNVYLEDPEGYKARARNRFAKEFGIKARPIDKEENYIKRCVGLPGDRIEMRDRQVYINDKALENPSEVQYNYYFRLKNQAQLQKVREELDLTELDFGNTGNQKNYGLLALTDGEYEKLMAMNVVDTIVLEDQSNLAGQLEIFPNSMMAPYNTWTPDNFGPIAIPADGWTYEINIETLPLYHRVIEVYEGNEVEVRDNQVYINGELATEYTFKQNYYWMMGDNRHNSADSRFWGFVPETHVVGKAVFTWFSKENALQHGSSDIRWNRMFRLVD